MWYFFFEINNSGKWYVLGRFLRFIKVYYEENNVHLQGNATKNIFILAAILDFLEKQSQNWKA